MLYIQEDVHRFLDKYDHVTNTLACIIRSFQDVQYLTVFCAVGAIIGVHLVQPFLSVTYYDILKYSELIPAMKTLYQDLTTCDPDKLTDLTQPAFSFITSKRFKDCNKCWSLSILSTIESAVTENKERVVGVLKVLLPRLADGWFKQRGNVFGFGDYDTNSPQLLDMHDVNKLDYAPINNLDSEHDVGSIN